MEQIEANVVISVSSQPDDCTVVRVYPFWECVDTKAKLVAMATVLAQYAVESAGSGFAEARIYDFRPLETYEET